MPGHPFRAFVVAYGPGGNGKTQVAELFRGFVGEENAAAVEIDELTDDDFATGDLPGKFINWGDDMAGDGGGTLQELSLLKKATGGSKIRANEKFEKTFDFTNEAAMFFSANEPPRIGERKRSMQDRIYPIEMPYKFVSKPDPEDPMEKKKEPNVSGKLLENDAAMRGLLVLAVEHAQELLESRGQYSQPEDPEERLAKYNQSADPIVRFAGRAVEPSDPDTLIRKDDVYRVYRSFVESWGERGASERGFKRQFPKAFTEDIENARSRELATPDDEKDRVVCWKRLTWTETALREMPDWMQERYADHFADVVDESEDVEGDDDRDSSSLHHPEVVTIDEIDPDKQLSASVIAQVDFSGDWDGINVDGDGPDWQASLDDESGTEASLVAWDEEDIPGIHDKYGALEPDAVHVKGAKVSENEGTLQLVITSETDVVAMPEDEAQQQFNAGGEKGAATDGGSEGDERSAEGWEPDEDAEGVKAAAQRVVATLVASDADGMSREHLCKTTSGRYPGQGYSASELENAIDVAISEKGWLVEDKNGIQRP